MMVYITGINFNYGDLKDGFNSTEFKFSTDGLEYTLDGPITISKDAYMANSSDIDAQRQLVKNKVAEELQDKAMIYITNINFNYNEFKDGFNNVTFNFITTGVTFNLNGPVTISKADYTANSSDVNAMRQLVKDKIIADLS